ncbi:hypothetical protein PC119_g9863 [Phytophthora cactorum]|nr:hypothetical protein PC119_g9863 [Phytophthora cactorum]
MMSMRTSVSHYENACEELFSPVRNPRPAFNCRNTVHLFQSYSQTGALASGHRLSITNVIQGRKHKSSIRERSQLRDSC